MIEIAIAIGVIGFALVAIIGILPQGMNVQKDNREDTIISQDAPYFLAAIRNGEMRTNNGVLTNYVESISITNITATTTTPFNYTNTILLGLGTAGNGLPTDMSIIGLLCTPELESRSSAISGSGVTNQVTAIVRAMTGSAIQQNGANSVTAFRYQLTVEIDPWNSIAPDSTNFNGYTAGTPDYVTRLNRYNEVNLNYLGSSLHEVRLKFAWPVLPNGSVGPGRQTYRSLVSSHLELTNSVYTGSTPLWFFQPQIYTTNTGAMNL